MVDFGALMKSGNRTVEIDPELIFEQLPKSNRVNDLYSSQAAILRQWFTTFRDKRDILSNSILEVEKRSSAC